MRIVCCILVAVFGAMLLACGGAGSPSTNVQDKAAVGRGFNRGDNDLEGRTDSTPQEPIIETAEAALKKYLKGKVEVSGTSTVKILEAGKSWIVSGRYDSSIDKRHEFQSIIVVDADGKYEAGNLMLDGDVVMDKIRSKASGKEKPEGRAIAQAKGKPAIDIEDRKTNAQVFSEKYVRKFLKHPDDASFGLFSIPTVKTNAEGDTFYVESTVKAKNDFGALLTHRWATILTVDDNTWELVSCAIDDKQVYEDEKLLSKLKAKRQASERAEQTAAKRVAAEERKQEQAAMEEAKWRTWTDATGKHKTEAKYSGVVAGKVNLIKRDGKKLQLPLDKLSDEDREWIDNRLKRPATP